MELRRRLPASKAAPDLSRPAIDLAVGDRLPGPIVDEVKALAAELLMSAAPRPAGAMELRVKAET